MKRPDPPYPDPTGRDLSRRTEESVREAARRDQLIRVPTRTCIFQFEIQCPDPPRGSWRAGTSQALPRPRNDICLTAERAMCGCYVPRRLRNRLKIRNGKMKLRTIRELQTCLLGTCRRPCRALKRRLRSCRIGKSSTSTSCQGGNPKTFKLP
jgi:hypothetical protein